MAALQARLNLALDEEAGRYAAREALAALFEPWFAARPSDEVARALDSQRVTWGPYRSVQLGLAEDPRFSLHNPMFETQDTPGIGRHLAAGSPVRMPGEDRQQTPPAPLLGTHTDDVLAQVLGLSAAAIGALHDRGIVAGPERDPTA